MNLQETIRRILKEETQIPIPLRRRLHFVDEELIYRLSAVYRPDSICRFESGEELLDVIGEGAQSIQGGIHKDLVEKAYEFIVQSHNDFKKSQDFNMHTRYGLLRSYFESRVHLWSIEPIQSL